MRRWMLESSAAKRCRQTNKQMRGTRSSSKSGILYVGATCRSDENDMLLYSTIASYSPFQKECPIWGPAAGDQLLLRPVICGADVRPRGCREIALVSLARAAWAVAMQSAHARALLPALPWQLM